MFRFAKNAAAAIALSGFVLSQPALAVRSYESLPAPSAKVTSLERVGSTVDSKEQLEGIPVIGWLIGLAVVVAVIAIVASDNNNNKSPG